MEYRNTKTGIIITVASPVTGEFWEPVEKPAPEKPKAEPRRKAVKNAKRDKA